MDNKIALSDHKFILQDDGKIYLQDGDSAVEVSNQKEVFAAMAWKGLTPLFNEPYSLLCSVEEDTFYTSESTYPAWTGTDLPRKVKVTFFKPEEKRKELLTDLMKTDQEYGMYDQPEEKETQEEWIFKLRDYEVYFGDWYGLPGTSYVKLTRKEK